MQNVLCGISAFRYYRIPSQLLDSYPSFMDFEVDEQHKAFLRHPLVNDVLKMPIHLLVPSENHRTGAREIKQHYYAGADFEVRRNAELGIAATSPAATLFTMSKHLSFTRLVMAMYEFCGSFSVFNVPQRFAGGYIPIASTLDDNVYVPWRRSSDASNLWMRKPLVELDELRDFADQVKGRRGANKFIEAVSCVNGIAASPFEVELTMLLTMPRKYGGEGIAGFENNRCINLDVTAQAFAQKQRCYADLFHKGKAKRPPLVLECQGEAFHDALKFGIADADRSLGLESMGFDVLELTHKQIAREQNYQMLLEEIYSRLGLRRYPKSMTQRRAERDLRAELFIDWADLDR